jgi:deazaflavin-dependent oxidoreductase (nitroreductase family)
MGKTYRLGPGQRLANAAATTLTKLGLVARYRYVLTVRGRTTGVPRSTPVDVMTPGDDRFLVVPYREVNWVRNLRAATELTLTRRGHAEAFTAQKVNGGDAVSALRTYIRRSR